MLTLREIIQRHQLWLVTEGVEGERAKLNKTELIDVDLSDVDLRYADVSETYLKDVNFFNTKLIGACFAKSKIISSSFEKADLSEVDFSWAVVENSNFAFSRLNGSSFTNSTLKNISIENIKLRKNDISSAEIIDVEIINSEVLDLNFNNSSFNNCKFTNSIIRHNDFQGAILDKLDFSESLLVDNNLKEIDYRGVSAIGAIIVADQFDDSFGPDDALLSSVYNSQELPYLHYLKDIRRFHKLQPKFIDGQVTVDEFTFEAAALHGDASPLYSGTITEKEDGESDAVTVKVLYVTNRQASGKDLPDELFTSTPDDKLSYGELVVYIPDKHNLGSIEQPGWITKIPIVGKVIKGLYADKYFHLLSHSVISDPGGFFDSLRMQIKGEVLGSFLFVHGYNQTFSDAAKRAAQLAYDLKLKLQPIIFSWPSSGCVLKGKMGINAYTQDSENAVLSQEYFQEFLFDLLNKVDQDKVHIIAHSMGNRVVAHAVQLLSKDNKAQGIKTKIKTIILAAPDIGLPIFKSLANEINQEADCVTIYSSKKDKILTLSERLHNMVRLGNTDPIEIIKDMDCIDASTLDTSKFFETGEHSHFAKFRPMLNDLYSLLVDNKSPTDRFDLIKRYQNGEPYWVFRK